MPNSFHPPPPQPDRGFHEEVGKRAGEAGGGLAAAMRAVAIEDHRRMLALHAQRVCQDHRAQQMAAGFRALEDGLECEGEDLDMGDISVTGDNYNYYTNAKSTASKALPYLAAALLGSIIPLTIMFLMRDKPVVIPEIEDTNTDTIVTVE